MKFKLKLPNGLNYVNIRDESEVPTLGSLRCATSSELETLGLKGVPFELSLNGQDILCGEDDMELSSLGIVPGDIIRLVMEMEGGHAGGSMDTSTGNDTGIDMAGNQSSATQEGGNNNNNTLDGEKPVDSQIVNRYLRKPILCRESTEAAVPELLQTSFAQSEVVTVLDALAVVLNVLMMEAGFVPKTIDWENPYKLHPSSKLSGQVYRTAFVHTSCPDLVATLTSVPMGGSLVIVNGSWQTTVYHLRLRPNQYVCAKNIQSRNAATVYTYVAKLSHKFKDGVVYPLLSALQSEAGVPQSCGIFSLPIEMRLHIFKFLPAAALLNVSEVCKEFYMLSEEPTLWKRRCLIEFPEYMSQKLIAHQNVNWKEVFKAMHDKKKRRNSYQGPACLLVMPPFPRIRVPGLRPFNPIMPLMPPGVLGGDYDRIGLPSISPNQGPLLPPPGPWMLMRNPRNLNVLPNIGNMFWPFQRFR